MKDQDSLWIINPLNWYYKFSKSIVISVFYPFLLLLLSSQSLRRLCQTSRHLTLPFQPGRTDSVHVRPTPCLRGLNNLSNLRLYDTCSVKNCDNTWEILAKHHNTGNFWLHFSKKHPEVPKNADDIERSESAMCKCFLFSFFLKYFG
jgi:hypothetical protein